MVVVLCFIVRKAHLRVHLKDEIERNVSWKRCVVRSK